MQLQRNAHARTHTFGTHVMYTYIHAHIFVHTDCAYTMHKRSDFIESYNPTCPECKDSNVIEGMYVYVYVCACMYMCMYITCASCDLCIPSLMLCVWVYVDVPAGHYVCTQCGTVVGDRVIQDCSEWRTFDTDKHKSHQNVCVYVYVYVYVYVRMCMCLCVCAYVYVQMQCVCVVIYSHFCISHVYLHAMYTIHNIYTIYTIHTGSISSWWT